MVCDFSCRWLVCLLFCVCVFYIAAGNLFYLFDFGGFVLVIFVVL